MITASLKDGLRRSETAVEDEFIRRFMTGTWHGLVCSEVIIKRQFNHIRVAAIVRRAVSPTKMYFLLGYTEELLANWLQCPVTLELQTVDSFKDVVFNETAGRAAKYQAPPELLHIRYDDPLYSRIPRTSYEPTRYTADAPHPRKDLILSNKY
ncbi:28S ribosomal protein S24, mitochondrial [Eumeta japonica]|uniref:28S ribosomal protein S24, mitochondrial n=1 Tax=Eumeta variegata TaxID=151549 RepID=A0A4C1TLY6_EUMVA|nr:28S ribosomal protein S24, mitochondrial [Eumeta japonica]